MKAIWRWFLRARIFVPILLIVAVFALWQYAIAHEKARSRDLRRISDALTIQTAFEKMYLHDRGYTAAAEDGCEEIGQPVQQCNLHDYYREIDELRDPGKYGYVISKVPNRDGYEVTFQLEISHHDLKKGQHTISQEGIE
ncbi:MAG: hypothetical protein PHH01_04305 [Patescibacteria group bacterium]|nr:hypothetical protein [Patescibacteria group bacterium]